MVSEKNGFGGSGTSTAPHSGVGENFHYSLMKRDLKREPEERRETGGGSSDRRLKAGGIFELKPAIRMTLISHLSQQAVRVRRKLGGNLNIASRSNVKVLQKSS